MFIEIMCRRNSDVSVKIKPRVIQKSFKKSGISNTRNRIEDY